MRGIPTLVMKEIINSIAKFLNYVVREVFSLFSLSLFLNMPLRFSLSVSLSGTLYAFVLYFPSLSFSAVTSNLPAVNSQLQELNLGPNMSVSNHSTPLPPPMPMFMPVVAGAYTGMPVVSQTVQLSKNSAV